MGALSASDRGSIAESFAQGDVEGGYARLGAFADLKPADLPQLDKAALARLGEQPDLARAFVAGLVSPAPSVRRMARKYAPKLSGQGPGALLLLLAECLRPFRRLAAGETGLAGRFGEWATPLGPAIVEAGLSFDVPNTAVAVYSPATRLLKDALENLAGALGLSTPAAFVRGFEYVSAVVRPFARVHRKELPDDGLPAQGGYSPLTPAGLLYGALQALVPDRARKQDPALLAALERWCRAELVLEDEVPPGTAEAALRARWRELPEDERRAGVGIMPVLAGDLLRGSLLPQPARLAIYWRIKAGPPPPSDDHRFLLEGTLAGFARELPRETAGPAPTTPQPLAPEGAHALLQVTATSKAPPAKGKARRKGGAAEAATATSPTPPAAAAPEWRAPADPHLGPGCEEGLDALHRDRLDDLATHATVTAARQALQAAARPGDERAPLLQPIFGRFWREERGWVPAAALDAPWAEPLAALLAGLERPVSALGAALCVLSPRALASQREAWERQAAALASDDLGLLRDATLAALVEREPGLAPVIGPLVARHAQAWGAMGEGLWEFALAALYVGHGEDGRAAARRAVAASRLPWAEKHYRCHCSGLAYRYLFRRAWELRDADLLGAALARLAVPIYWKGKRGMIPSEDALQFRGNYAPQEGTAPPAAELALEEVVAFVARERPARLAEAIAAAGEAAAFEKGARAVLDAALGAPEARRALEARLPDLVALLEAPQEAPLRSGLLLLAPLAALLGEHLPAVMTGLERAVTSTSPGVVQAAAGLLGAIAVAHPDQQAAAVALLEECLQASNVPTAEEALRALGKACGGGQKPSRKKGAAAPIQLTAQARQRIAHWAREEPQRLGKLAQALIG